MSDAFWFLLDHPDQRDLTKLDGNIQYVSPHFDRDVYEAARGVSFMNFEDAYDNWRLYGRRQGLEFAPSKNTILKIILKVKDEVDLIDKWIDHHAKIVGLHNRAGPGCLNSFPRTISAFPPGSFVRWRRGVGGDAGRT